MSKKLKEVTPFVRQAIRLWLVGVKDREFSVAEASQALQVEHSVFAGIDTTKAVSNELIRLETLGLLTSRKGVRGEGCGVGRLPRVYSKKYCKNALYSMIGVLV